METSEWVVVGIDNGGNSNNATILDASGRFLVDRLVETPSRVTDGPEVAIDALAMASMATAGPSVTRLGVSTSRSTRKPLDASRMVALLLFPPLSMPMTTLSLAVPISVPSPVSSRP